VPARILAALCSLAVTAAIACGITPSASFAAEGDLTLRFNSVDEVLPGEEFTLQLSVENNEIGLGLVTSYLEFDGNTFEILSVTNGGLVSDADFEGQAEPVPMIGWSTIEDSATDCVTAYATFRVKDTAAAGTYEITISERDDGCFATFDLETYDPINLSPVIVPATVAVASDEPLAGYEWYTTPAGENAYEIGTASELAEFANIVNGTVPPEYGIAQDNFAGKAVTLTADVDLSAIADWAPIGSDYEHAFKGTFDGAGKAISSLTVVGGADSYQGLFGCSNGTIKNFSIAGTISGTSGDFYGAVVGFNFGTIEDVISTVDISAAGVYNVGGVAGFNTSGVWVIANSARVNIVQPTFDDAVGLVQRCGWEGIALTAANKVGGIVGENAGTVKECYSGTGAISAPGSGKGGAGGIVGRNGCNNNADETGFVDSCYSFAAVGSSGDRWFGGITGFQNNTYGKPGKSPVSSTSNCYFAGSIVRGYSSNWGPMVGEPDGGKVPANGSNNYTLEGLSSGGSSEIVKGIVKTEAELKAPAMVGLLNGEGSAFNVDSDGINGGYPVLAWQGGTPFVKTPIADVTVTGLKALYAAEGQAAEQALVLTYTPEGGEEAALVEGVDYELSYEGNVAPETAGESTKGTVTITGIGAYEGTRTLRFKLTANADANKTIISKAAVSGLKSVRTTTLDGPAVQDALVLTYTPEGGEAVTLVEGTDYELSYANNTETGTAQVYITGIGDWKGTIAKNFKCYVDKPSVAKCTVSGLKVKAYTGEPIEQDLTVAYTKADGEEVTLVEGEDYELSYENNIGPAPQTNPAKVIITGLGDFGGTRTMNFKITG
jgi:hypothetical protein